MKKFIPSFINPLLNLMGIFVILGSITYVGIQTFEIFQRREFLHLTIFTLFFLISSFQLSISNYFGDMGFNEHSLMLFGASIIMFSAGFFELIDVAIDHFLKNMENSNYSLLISFGSLLEYLIALFSIILALISLARFRYTIKIWVPAFLKIENK